MSFLHVRWITYSRQLRKESEKVTKTNSKNKKDLEIRLNEYVMDLMEHPEAHSSAEICNLPKLVKLLQERTAIKSRRHIKRL